MVDRLEFEGAGYALGIALLDVEGGGEPEIRLDIGTPAVEVVVLGHFFLGTGKVAVEADDVAVAGLDPDAAEETARGALAVDRRHAEGDRRRIAEECRAGRTLDVGRKGE